jgi:hypothetical protein
MHLSHLWQPKEPSLNIGVIMDIKSKKYLKSALQVLLHLMEPQKDITQEKATQSNALVPRKNERNYHQCKV